MVQAGSLLSMLVGAAFFGVASRLAIPPAAWIGLISLVHGLRSMRVVPGTACLWIALYAALAIAKRDTMPIPGVIYFAIIAVEASVVTAPFLLDRLLAPRLTGVAATLIFPIALVAAEFLRSRVTGAASWGSIAYSQYGFLPLMQVAAVAGIWGITFLMAWFASTFDWSWSRGFAWAEVRGPVLTCGLVLGAIVLGGNIRLALAATDRGTLRAVAVNRPPDLFIPGEMTRISEGRVSPDERDRFADKLSRLQDWFLEGSRREARAGARLVVWPEQNLLIFKEDEMAFLERAKRLARDERVYLAMGMGTIYLGDTLPFENKLILIDPSGAIVMTHVKSRPVVGWEAGIMRRGDGRASAVSTADGRMAGAICFEADFPELIRYQTGRSADLLIVPVNDWKSIKEIHFRMHVFRAIEDGVPLVRAAASGLSAAIDPWGRVLAVSDFFASGDRTMTAQVPIGRIPTLYARTGDLFAWICVALVVVALGFGAMESGRRSVGLLHASERGVAATVIR
jgi:apolipoprotein N-acyltransferase